MPHRPMPESDSASHHDPRDELAREETLTLLALGEPVDGGFDAHVRDCGQCQTELAALRRTVAMGRHVGELGSEIGATPSPAVWARITAELGLATPSGSGPGRGRSDRGRTDGLRTGARRHWAALAAAAVLIAAAGTGGGYLAGRTVGPNGSAVAASAVLRQMPGGPTGVRGIASVRDVAGGPQVSVRTVDLPLREGYYEVWLYDPSANKMVAVGTLPQGGEASFPIPPGLNVRAYHVVDVSAQDYDGNPAHKQSVLRGALAQ